jgi:hypothetical protein
MRGVSVVGIPTVQSGGVVWEHDVECMQEHDPTAVMILIVLAIFGLAIVLTLAATSYTAQHREKHEHVDF